MVLWQSDLRVSWRAQWLSLLIHGLVAAAILLMPWPLSYTPLWMVLLSLVVFDCVRSQRRINARQGEIRLLMDGRLRWQPTVWMKLNGGICGEFCYNKRYSDGEANTLSRQSHHIRRSDLPFH